MLTITLPKNRQHAMECRFVLDMTDREIGTAMGVRPCSVRSYLTRARKTVRRICRETGCAL